jgi:hypothetical protein
MDEEVPLLMEGADDKKSLKSLESFLTDDPKF